MEMNIPDERRIRLADELPILLLSEPPLPVFTLRLLYQLLACWPKEFAEILPKSGVLEVLITFVEMQSTEQTNLNVQKQLFPLLCLIWETGSLESTSVLLDNDITEVCGSLKIFRILISIFVAFLTLYLESKNGRI